MRNILYFFLVLLIASAWLSCNKKVGVWPVSDFKFDGMFGQKINDEKAVYILQGTGFFRAPKSENSDSLAKAWIGNHPSALVHPVSRIGGNQNGENIFYCWIIDQKDTLNNYLVKVGACPGGTMIRPKTWNEMPLEQRELYGTEKYDVDVFIKDKPYNQFIEQIRVAEQYAQSKKLGIWKK